MRLVFLKLSIVFLVTVCIKFVNAQVDTLEKRSYVQLNRSSQEAYQQYLDLVGIVQPSQENLTAVLNVSDSLFDDHGYKVFDAGIFSLSRYFEGGAQGSIIDVKNIILSEQTALSESRPSQRTPPEPFFVLGRVMNSTGQQEYLIEAQWAEVVPNYNEEEREIFIYTVQEYMTALSLSGNDNYTEIYVKGINAIRAGLDGDLDALNTGNFYDYVFGETIPPFYSNSDKKKSNKVEHGGYYLTPAGVPIFLPDSSYHVFFYKPYYVYSNDTVLVWRHALMGFEIYSEYCGNEPGIYKPDGEGNVFIGYQHEFELDKYYKDCEDTKVGSRIDVRYGRRLIVENCNSIMYALQQWTPNVVDENGEGVGDIITVDPQVAGLGTWAASIALPVDTILFCLDTLTYSELMQGAKAIQKVDVYSKDGVLDSITTVIYDFNPKLISIQQDNEGNLIYYQYSSGDNTWYQIVEPGMPEFISVQDFVLACWTLAVGSGHFALDLLGFFPVVGEVADGINGIWYLAEGDVLNASVTFAAMVPVLGTGATAGKWFRKVGNNLVPIKKLVGIYGKSANDLKLIARTEAELDAIAAQLTTDQVLNLNKDFTSAPEILRVIISENGVNAWEVGFKHGDDIRLNTEFLGKLSKHLDEFPNLKPDLDDLDVFNAYKKISDDVEQSYEILDDVEGNLALLISQKIQNSNAPNFWKWVRNGKKFETDYLLPKFKNRATVEYTQLKNKASTEFGVNLDEFDMYSQVQLKYNGSDYFIADQVYVRWVNVNGTQVIDDIVVIENKLKSTTKLTTNQNAGRAASSLEIRNVNLAPESAVSGNNLTNQLPPISTNDKWLKVYDSENGEGISGIDKL